MTYCRACLGLFLCTAIASAADLSTLNGKRFSGDIVSMDPKGIVFKIKDGAEQTFLPTEIISLDVGSPLKDPGQTAFIDVELVDGSLFRCTNIQFDGKNAKLVLLSGSGAGETLEVPLTSLYYMIRDAQNAKNKLDFISLLNEYRKQRRDIWVRNIQGRLDAMPGTFGDGNAEKASMEFTRDGADKGAQIKLTAIYGMGFNQTPTGEQVAPTICRVIDVNRNTLVAKAVNFGEKGVSIITVAGVMVNYPSLDNIHKFDFSTASMRYLSDLEPVQVDETSTDIVYKYTRDKNLDGQEIRVGGTAYAKGLSAHARTSLSYNINGDYKQFRAVLGVDDAWDNDAKVKVTIESDGKELFKKFVLKKDKPIELNLDVRGTKILRLVVESELFDFGNMVNFADARVTK